MPSDSAFEKLLDALLIVLRSSSGSVLDNDAENSEEKLTNAMLKAMRRGKQYMRPRTFGSN